MDFDSNKAKWPWIFDEIKKYQTIDGVLGTNKAK